MDFDFIENEFIEAEGIFKAISPGISDVLAGEAAVVYRVVTTVFSWIRKIQAVNQGKPVADLIGEEIGGKIIGKAVSPIRKVVIELHQDVLGTIQIEPKKDSKKRTWIEQPGKTTMVVVFHDAKKAGPHIDIHIGQLSVVYRLPEPLYQQLKFNKDGMLTEDSKKAIINHVKSEIASGKKIPQNLDHAPENARESWVNGDPDDKSYGAGKTRQVVSESVVDVYKTSKDGPIEFYAPVLNPHRAMYIYKVYPGDEKKAPILIIGNKSHHPPKFEDRLHLKLVHPEDLEKLIAKSDMETSTAKYDGASAYIVIGPKGTTVWSPRISSKTGEQIEYTPKINRISDITSPDTIVGMGEIVFTRDGEEGYLSSSTISGLLNSNKILPDDIHCEIRLYRIDQMNKKDTKDLSFWENRALQEQVSDLRPEVIKVVELMDPETAKDQGFEGVVAVPSSGSINDGYKVKWWGDTNDWVIDSVEFKTGPKGGIAGVIWLTSLESGKKFKLGPGQMGDRELCEEIMAHPERFIGTVVEVQSRQGHEGRAAKVLGFHQDKGMALEPLKIESNRPVNYKEEWKRGDKFQTWNPRGNFSERWIIQKKAVNYHICAMCNNTIEIGTLAANSASGTFRGKNKSVHVKCISKLKDVVRE